MARVTSAAARNVAQAERQRLCDLLEEVGPTAPTLCDGWTTQDLAAHLYVRERETLAAMGLVLPPLSRHLHARMRAASTRPWSELVTTLRKGPPAPMAWVDGLANLVEFVVHREDVRRALAARDHTPLTEDRNEHTLAIIWQRLRSAAPMMFRGLPVTLLWDGHGRIDVRSSRTHRVTLTGSPVDLLLVATGRDVAISVNGEASAVAEFSRQRRGI